MAGITRTRAVQGREICGLALASAALLLAPVQARAQLLDRASEAVRGTDDQGYSGSSSTSSSRDDDDDSSSCPTPRYDDDDDDYRSSSSGSDDGYRYSSADAARYPRRRYASSGSIPAEVGYSSGGIPADAIYSVAPYEETWWDEEDRDWRSGLRLDTELGYAIGGAGRGAFGARAHLGWVGITARYSGFLDPSGVEVRGAMLGRIGLEIFIVNEPGGEVRLGGAFRHWQDHFGGEYGFDVGLSFDVYPLEPLIVSGELAIGMLGASVVVLARAEVGVMLDSTELFLGYHYEALAGQSSYVDLGGPMLGVRVWL
jgi:hypothetical protein